MNLQHPKAQESNSPLYKFLLRYAVPKGNSFTHTSLGKPLGTFYIPAEATSEFYKIYVDAIENGEEVCLTEKHRHISPVIVDIDLRFSITNESDTPKRVYTTKDVKDIVQVYINELVNIFRQSGQTQSFCIYVLEKPSPTIAQKKLKDGIHIVIPDLVSKPSVQYILRNRVLPKLAPIFERLGVINKVEDVVDESIIERNNWMMYGSCKPNSDKYEVSHIYEYVFATGTCEDVIDEYELTTSDLLTELSIRNKHDESGLTPEVMEDVNAYERILEEKRRKIETAKAIISDELSKEENEHHNIEEVKQLVDVLSPNRADGYNDWIRVGWCLRNIDHRLLSKWIDFSKKSPKYKDGECEKIWPLMKRSGLGVGTLHMWAKKDSPQQYAEIIRKDLRKLLSESRSGTHNDVARVVHYMFQHEYVCTSIKHKTWYEFRTHRWHQSDSAFTLRMRLSNEVWREYMAAARDLSHRATEVTDHEQQEKFQDYARKMMDIATKLKTCSFKDNVMKECSEMFYVEKFVERLDSQTNLIGFENGVYDLEAQEFREGRPEDYVSFSTGINYIQYDPSHPIVDELKSYFAQVLPIPSVRQYVLKLFATFLSGNIKEQKFNIWTGSGSNSKSLCVNLFENSFGDYCCKFPITLLTQKRAASNAATSELARAKGKRFACLQEPSEDEKLNIGLMKELSGGDKIMARALFSDPIEFAPQFKMLLLCNHLPSVPSDDGGTWRRIRVVEFTSKFVDNPIEENEFPIDYDLPDKMQKWKKHFMAMLIDYYRLYKIEGNPEPEQVMQCTRDYKRQNDHLSDFIASCLEQKAGNNFLSMNEAFSELKSWAKDDNVPVKIPTKSDLEKYLSKFLGKCITSQNVKGFRGWRIKARYDTTNGSTSKDNTQLDQINLLGDDIDP
jgi:P4 family phage/plasmid primase-like protien